MMIVMLFIAVLTGCGKKDSDGSINSQELGDQDHATTTSSDKQVVIRLMTRWGRDQDEGTAALLELVDKFQEENPTIKVIDESVPGGSDDKAYYDKLKTSIAIGDLYEVSLNYGGGSIKNYVENDLFLDMEPYLEEDQAWANRFHDLFDLWQFDSVKGTYGIPLKYFAVTMYYNKDLFEQFGLEPPETIADFEDVSKVFIENDIVPMAMAGKNNWRHAHLITSLSMKRFGFDKSLDLGRRKAKYTDSDTLELFQMIDAWHKMGIFGENILSMDYDMEKMMFKTDQTAMHMDGTWFAGELADTEGFEEGKYGYINFPYFKEHEQFKTSAMGGADGGLSIANIKDEAKREAAVKLVKYIMSNESIDYIYSIDSSQLFAIKSSPQYPDNPFYDEITDVLNNQLVTLRQEIDAYDPLPQLLDRLRNAIQGMLAGNTPEEAAAEIQAEIDRNER